MSEIGYQIIIGFLAVALIAAIGYIVTLRRVDPPTFSDTTIPTDWHHITQKLPLGTVTQATTNAEVSAAFRESLIMRADDRKTIFDLQAIVVTKNETIVLKDGKLHVQSGLLRESALTMAWKDKLILLQENKIRVFEKNEASRLFDDYREHEHSIARGDAPTMNDSEP